ncbi:MAG: hypothetical protein Q9160_006900 [Pyrenula sp. 1 TL-2023]
MDDPTVGKIVNAHGLGEMYLIPLSCYEKEQENRHNPITILLKRHYHDHGSVFRRLAIIRPNTLSESPLASKLSHEEIFLDNFNGPESIDRGTIDEEEICFSLQMRKMLSSSDGFTVVSSWYRNPTVAARLPTDELMMRYGDFAHLCYALDIEWKEVSFIDMSIVDSEGREISCPVDEMLEVGEEFDTSHGPEEPKTSEVPEAQEPSEAPEEARDHRRMRNKKRRTGVRRQVLWHKFKEVF